jgi:hypothetical protein
MTGNLWETPPIKGVSSMQFDSEGKKKPYSSPTVRKLTLEQAKQFVADRANCNDQEAADFLESLAENAPGRPPNAEEMTDPADLTWDRKKSTAIVR